MAAKNGSGDEETRIIGEVMKRQYIHERIAEAACDLYASSCTLSRLDHLLTLSNGSKELQAETVAGHYFLKIANRRIKQNLAALWDHDDELTTRAADTALESL